MNRASSFLVTTTIVVLLVSSASHAMEKICVDWFSKQNIQAGARCEWDCVAAPMDMGTFYCSSDCKELCKVADDNKKIPNATLYYPYLNPAEVALSLKHPKEAMRVYQQKDLAEKRVLRLMGRNEVDDESDAIRHFIWAGLLAKELGLDLAKEFLDAHEVSEDVSSPSRAMDLANNRAGLTVSDRLRRNGVLDLKTIEDSALEELKQRRLVVLKPQGGPR